MRWSAAVVVDVVVVVVVAGCCLSKILRGKLSHNTSERWAHFESRLGRPRRPPSSSRGDLRELGEAPGRSQAASGEARWRAVSVGEKWRCS